MSHCFKAGIPMRGLLHDLSKYTPTEFCQGVKYYSGVRSPNEGEREQNGYSLAWMHHKGRNRHHFEYWTDYNLKEHKVAPVKMPLKFVVEMFCDRVAASKIYQKEKYTDKSALEYYQRRSDSRKIYPETAQFLEKLLHMLSEEGEEKTFSFIRAYMKNNDTY